jgi:membrane protease YdiL (CAAX protease family)
MAVMDTLISIGYRTVYAKTDAIEAATLTHFAINILHLLLFYCPMLAANL